MSLEPQPVGLEVEHSIVGCGKTPVSVTYGICMAQMVLRTLSLLAARKLYTGVGIGPLMLSFSSIVLLQPCRNRASTAWLNGSLSSAGDDPSDWINRLIESDTWRAW